MAGIAAPAPQHSATNGCPWLPSLRQCWTDPQPISFLSSLVIRSVSARDAPARMSRRPVTRFINRSDELRQLSQLHARPRAQLVIVSARPGQGKTTLVRQWLRAGGHAALYWTAERGTPDNQLRSFSQALRAYLHPRERPAADWTYPDWKVALRDLGITLSAGGISLSSTTLTSCWKPTAAWPAT